MSGYIFIEHYTLIEAFYMTIITIATVGFGEVHPLSDAGRLFTAFLIMSSFGIFAYSISLITRYIVDGEFQHFFKSYRMNNTIEKIENHVIICGYGRNGRQAAHILKQHDQRFVVVEQNHELVASITHRFSHLLVEGDATDDEVLQKAGITRAKALITTLPTDADNLFIVLSARSLNANLTIISRASDDNSDKKLKTAGANNVIMPDKVGGAHMASLVLKPDVVEFIDFITEQGENNINLEEFTFTDLREELRNKTIADIDVRSKSGANIIGFKTDSGQFVVNPSPDTKISPNAKLFVLGTNEQIKKLKGILS
ncbi:MAG: potassium channel protein [Bacteroidetes bacterium]|nr:potassium channel protein [Bacteroidota bacterium]